MDATTRFDSQRVGALPVIVAYLEKMRLAAVIDENIPWVQVSFCVTGAVGKKVNRRNRWKWFMMERVRGMGR